MARSKSIRSCKYGPVRQFHARTLLSMVVGHAMPPSMDEQISHHRPEHTCYWCNLLSWMDDGGIEDLPVCAIKSYYAWAKPHLEALFPELLSPEFAEWVGKVHKLVHNPRYSIFSSVDRGYQELRELSGEGIRLLGKKNRGNLTSPAVEIPQIVGLEATHPRNLCGARQ